MTRKIPSSVQAILVEVSKRTGIAESDILSGKRARIYSRPRQEVFALVRQRVKIGNAPASYPLIGHWLGFDHSTVIHGERRHLARQKAEAAA